MSITASPPPALPPVSTAGYGRNEDDLDDEITNIRAQIRELTQRRRLVSSTLLGSNRIQAQLNSTSINDSGSSPIISDAQEASQENIHRIAFGVTSFPYTDPSPNTSNVPLLGVRIDICSRTGKFDNPYYLHLKRVNDNAEELRVYRHTVPVHVPLRDYERQYLPLRDEGYGSELSNAITGDEQNLHMLVRRVRQDLVSWTQRREAIELLAEELGLVPEDAKESDSAENAPINYITAGEGAAKYGVKSVSATEAEARFARVTWTDDRLARVMISDQGLIVRAVAFSEKGRLGAIEKALVGDGHVSVHELSKRLELC